MEYFIKPWVLVCFFTVLISSASIGYTSPQRDDEGIQMDAFFHFRPAAAPRGVALFLPGASGLKIFDDDAHYFHTASWLNQKGWHVLLIDYKPAYKAANPNLKGGTGEKISWVAEQAVHWLRAKHYEVQELPLVLIGWSLGAEGIIHLINSPESIEKLGIHGAALFYPAIQDTQILTNQVPLLVFVGDADNVTPSKRVREWIDNRSASAKSVKLHRFPSAHHGFDVASLEEKRTIRLLPLIGPKATFKYNASAAADARSQLLAFLRDAE